MGKARANLKGREHVLEGRYAAFRPEAQFIQRLIEGRLSLTAPKKENPARMGQHPDGDNDEAEHSP
jgi:hypothetical protein